VNTTVFAAPDFKVQGSIAVLAADEKLASTLEFEYYKKMVEAKLITAGYQLASDPSKADDIALLAYGIDSGKTAQISRPVFGVVAGGYYAGSQYIMPSYGVVDVVNSEVTRFVRALAVDIVDARSIKSPPIKKRYEMRGKSTGECPVMLEVFDEILEAMFVKFPAVNATHYQHKVKTQLNC